MCLLEIMSSLEFYSINGKKNNKKEFIELQVQVLVCELISQLTDLLKTRSNWLSKAWVSMLL